MTPAVSVIIPARNADTTIGECLVALTAQRTPSGGMQIIVVDDGSRDRTAEIAQSFNVRVLRTGGIGAPAARNRGLAVADAPWLAFTDADCLVTRRWLVALLDAAERLGPHGLGAAGKTVGYRSQTPAARFVDLTGGLDAEAHLAHPVFPFAPTCNVLYRADALRDAGGFDERFAAYDACDLHHRLTARLNNDGRPAGEMFVYEPTAVVLHQHRAAWRDYRRQQHGYGRGYAQLFLKYPVELPWSMRQEVIAWARILRDVPATLRRGDAGLIARGTVVKQVAQRSGFCRTYYSPRERRRWRPASDADGPVYEAPGFTR